MKTLKIKYKELRSFQDKIFVRWKAFDYSFSLSFRNSSNLIRDMYIFFIAWFMIWIFCLVHIENYRVKKILFSILKKFPISLSDPVVSNKNLRGFSNIAGGALGDWNTKELIHIHIWWGLNVRLRLPSQFLVYFGIHLFPSHPFNHHLPQICFHFVRELLPCGAVLVFSLLGCHSRISKSTFSYLNSLTTSLLFWNKT